MNDQFLELEPFLIECIIKLLLSRLVLVEWQLLLLRLFEEVRHELLMGDKFEPSKCECRVLIRVQLIEQIS